MCWKPVVMLGIPGYCPGFNPSETYEFRHKEWDEVKTFRMADMHPLFNVAGLEWRPKREPKAARDWTNAKAYRP